MEFVAFFYNFGVFGFLLFAVPFLGIFGYSVVLGFQNRRKIDLEYLMLLTGCFLMDAISLFAGHTYFNSAVMMVILVLHTLLLHKVLTWKEETQ